MTLKDDQIARLEQEVQFLREERRRSVDALEMAANLGNFNTPPGEHIDRNFVLKETADKLRTLIRFKAISFYLVDENDNFFYQAYCDPEEYGGFIEKEVERLIDDHTFAWVLKRSRPVVMNAHKLQKNLILRALTTPSRVRGMLVGILDQEKKDIPDTIFSLLSIVMLSSSTTLESIETYEHMRRLNLELKKYALKSERLYQDIFENAPIAIFRSTPDGKFLKLNPKYAEIAGYESPEQMVQQISDIGKQVYLDPKSRDEYVAILNKQGYVLNHEVQLKRTDGQPFWASMNTRVVRDEYNRIVHYDGFLMDITEQKKAREDLIRAKEEAEAANQAKSEFLANMSHELRTPLNGMLGMMQLLEMGELQSKQKEFVRCAIVSGQRLTELLSNILDLSRIEKGRVVIEENQVMIRDIFRKISEIFGVVCREKGIMFHTLVDESIPDSLIGDEIRIKNILFNLTGNAIKFTSQGEVRLEAHLLTRDNRKKLNILFIISDTGVGIPDNMQKKIFDPFVQAESSYTRRFDGAGLGLSVVMRMLGIIGGNLCFASSQGQGSTFYISLPLRTNMLV